MEPQFVSLADVRRFEIGPGVTGRPLFGAGAMLNLLEFEPGGIVPTHSHEHEQMGIVIRGEKILVVDGVEHRLQRVEHSATCGPEGCLVLDVFQPVREDYRERWQGGART